MNLFQYRNEKKSSTQATAVHKKRHGISLKGEGLKMDENIDRKIENHVRDNHSLRHPGRIYSYQFNALFVGDGHGFWFADRETGMLYEGVPVDEIELENEEGVENE